jgi:hypothetical protein
MAVVLGDLVKIFLFSLLTGAGLFCLLAPDFLKRPFLVLPLCAGLGILQLAMIDGYLIAASRPIAPASTISLFVGLTTLAISAIVYRRTAVRALAEFAGGMRGLLSLRGALFLVLLCVVLAPLIRANLATTPYRIGIDQVGYAEASQYLVENGTIGTAQDALFRELQTTDAVKAKMQNIRDLHFNTYVDSEFLMKAFRWGFPGTVASLTLLTGHESVYRVEFSLLILLYALLLALCYALLRDSLSVGANAAFVITIAIALNCNLLNVYYEGELAEIFASPFVILMLALFLHARKLSTAPGASLFLSKRFLAPVGLFAVVAAGLFLTYNEALVLIAGYIYVTLLVDAVILRRTSRIALVYLAAGSAAGFALAFPVSAKWLPYTLANLSGLSHAGFWQPHWGSLAEIVGLFNMYLQTGYVLYQRSTVNEILNDSVSIVLAGLFLRYLFKGRELDRSFWLVPLVLILAAYVKMRFLDGILNYPYMKVYTLLLPLVACGIFAAIFDYCRAAKWPFVRYGQYVAYAIVIVMGLTYVAQYLREYKYVTADEFAMYRYEGARRFDDVAIVTGQYQPRISDFMLAPLISMNWVNESDYGKAMSPFLAKKVVAVLSADELRCMECVERRYSNRILYSNASYLVYDTGLRLRDICNPQIEQYTVDSLSNDDKSADWPNLPIPQCDFKLGATVRAKLNS